MDKETVKDSPSRRAALRKELRERTTGYIVASLGLVAGLAWNDAISSLIKYLFPLDQNGIAAKFIYAIAVTAAIVIISASLLRMLGPKENC